MFLPSFRFSTRALLSGLFCFSVAACQGQIRFSTNPTRFLVCDKGVGSFAAKLPDGASNSGVTVSITAAKQVNGLAVRACQAKLTWGHHELVVAPEAAQADIDVMGALTSALMRPSSPFRSKPRTPTATSNTRSTL
jgi:hypothetical protein